MGFASAFASGLIKGFHQNILNEQQARAKDDEKLDGYRQLLMKSMLSGDDVNLSAVNAVKDMIKSGEKQLEDRGPIDIFGRPSNRLKMETLNMSGIVNNVGKTVNIGGVDVPVRKSYYENTIIKDPAARGAVLIDSLRDLGETKIRSMFNTPEKKKALGQFYMNNITNVLRPQVLSKDGTEIVQILGPETVDIHSWMKTIVPIDQSEYSLTSSNHKKTGTMKDGDYILPINNQSGVIIKAEEFNSFLNKAEQDNLSGLARLHGFPDANEYLFESARQYKNKGEFFEALKDTLKLYTMNAHEAKSTEDMVAIGKYISTSEKGYRADPIKASYLMLPLVVNKDFQALDWLRSRGFREGVTGKGFDDRLKQFSGYSFEKLEGDFNALERTDGQLSQLIGLINEAGVEPDSPISGIFMFFNRIFGETGYVDQVAGLLGASADSDDANSRAIYARIKKEIGGSDVGSALVKIKTLKFIVAADLARAEDSQGRLSDQDLARNLAKLGGNYGTVKQGIESIKLLQRDIRKKLDGKKMLMKITTEARGRGYFTARDRKLLQADYMARKYLTAYHKSIGGSPEEAGQITGVDISLDTLSRVDENNQPLFEVEPGLVSKNGGQVFISTKDPANPIYVVVETTGVDPNTGVPKTEIKQYTGAEFDKAVGDGKIVTPQNIPDTSAAAGMPMAGIGSGQANATPPSSPAPSQLSLQDLGLNTVEDLPPVGSDGNYVIGGKKYKIVGMNPMKLEEVQ